MLADVPPHVCLFVAALAWLIYYPILRRKEIQNCTVLLEGMMRTLLDDNCLL